MNVEQTIISQYGTSATITQLVRNMDAYINPSADIDEFYNYVWNVATAQGFGLDIWGRIVGISRALIIPATPNYFGFSEAGASAFPFAEAPFYDGTVAATQSYLLSDDAYRQLIMVKALANISATVAPAINQLLQNMFVGRGRCYANDSGNMQMRYVFEFTLTPSEFAIMTQSGALPRPAGVAITLLNTSLPLFGFAEAGASASPFGEGVFISEGATHAVI